MPWYIFGRRIGRFQSLPEHTRKEINRELTHSLVTVVTELPSTHVERGKHKKENSKRKSIFLFLRHPYRNRDHKLSSRAVEVAGFLRYSWYLPTALRSGFGPEWACIFISDTCWAPLPCARQELAVESSRARDPQVLGRIQGVSSASHICWA
jgi:hypothetical protein